MSRLSTQVDRRFKLITTTGRSKKGSNSWLESLPYGPITVWETESVNQATVAARIHLLNLMAVPVA